jgi:hypothetical protein
MWRAGYERPAERGVLFVECVEHPEHAFRRRSNPKATMSRSIATQLRRTYYLLASATLADCGRPAGLVDILVK